MATLRQIPLAPSGAEHHKEPPQSLETALPQDATDKIKELKQEIRFLWNQGRGHRYQLGKRLAQLQAERAHPKTGTFNKDLNELHIPIHTAYRLIKFYRRVRLKVINNLLQFAKDSAGWGGIQNVDEWERAVQSEEANQKLAALAVLREKEWEKVNHAIATKQGRITAYRVLLSLTLRQRQTFKKAWMKLEEPLRTRLVYKAVLNAAKKNS